MQTLIEHTTYTITKKTPNYILLNNFYMLTREELEEDGINFDKLKVGDQIEEEIHYEKEVLFTNLKVVKKS